MVPIPSAATVPTAVVEVVANRAAAVGQGAGRVWPHRSATEGIAAHPRIGDALEVGPREFARATGETTRAEIPGRTTIEWTSTVKPTAAIERAAAVDSPAIEAAITAEVTGAATDVAAAAEITAAKVATAEVAAATAKIAASATSAAEVATAATETAAATTVKSTATMTATAAVCPRHRRGHHLAGDHGCRHHDPKPTPERVRPMHRVFSETGCSHHECVIDSQGSANLFECQRRGVGQSHAVDPPLDHMRRRLPLARRRDHLNPGGHASADGVGRRARHHLLE